jgi:hypothetical protein
MSTRARYAFMALVLAVVIGAFYLPRLWRRVRDLETPTQTEEQARREITQAPIATSSDVKVNVNIYWASAANADGLAPVQIELPLSADPAQRCRQLVEALILSPPTPGQRTLPADATLLDFYLLPDGTAIADFADTLSTGTSSGILSEQLAVDSITQTLASSVPQVRRLKILLHGQEADTLAGHVDLTGFFPVRTTSPANPSAPTPAAQSGGKSGQ